MALVTGASRGIGAAAGRAFARAGYAVVLSGRTQAALDAVAEEIEAGGGCALALAADVADEPSVERLVLRTVEEFGRLDAAFNNAGDVNPPAPLAELEASSFEKALRTNIVGTFLCMRAEIKAMQSSGGGSIVNMSSTAGLQGVAGLSSYCAGKHAVVGLTKAAALDYAAANIRVNVVAPGPIATERTGEAQRKHIAEFVPVKRMGTADEVAHLVLWLASDESKFVTGAVIPIDGGRLAGTPAFVVSS